jgi:hypothetical protein
VREEKRAEARERGKEERRELGMVDGKEAKGKQGRGGYH